MAAGRTKPARYNRPGDADLGGIYGHIAFELLSPGNATGQLDRQLNDHAVM